MQLTATHYISLAVTLLVTLLPGIWACLLYTSDAADEL